MGSTEHAGSICAPGVRISTLNVHKKILSMPGSNKSSTRKRKGGGAASRLTWDAQHHHLALQQVTSFIRNIVITRVLITHCQLPARVADPLLTLTTESKRSFAELEEINRFAEGSVYQSQSYVPIGVDFCTVWSFTV